MKQLKVIVSIIVTTALLVFLFKTGLDTSIIDSTEYKKGYAAALDTIQKILNVQSQADSTTCTSLTIMNDTLPPFDDTLYYTLTPHTFILSK